MTPKQPFDTAAADYDRTFSRRKLGIWLRELVRQHLPFRQGDHILELGCGTGEDAIWLARHSIHVTATDSSGEMLATAGMKINAAKLTGRIKLEQLNMNDLRHSPIPVQQGFDGVFSNFGAINCVEDRRALAVFLAGHIRRGRPMALAVMGPLCPWEIGWHLLHLEPHRAFQRLKSGELAHVGGGQTAQVWYPSPRRLRADFLPHFQLMRTVGIGSILPPTSLAHLVERWPNLFAPLASFDERFGSYFPLTWLNDHYLAIFERL